MVKNDVVNTIFSRISNNINDRTNIVWVPEAMTVYMAQYSLNREFVENLSSIDETERDKIRKWNFDYYMNSLKALKEDTVIYFDRFVHDAIAFAEYEKRTIPNYIIDYINEIKFELSVYLLSPPNDISSNNKQAQLSLYLKKCYQEHECNLFEVDYDTVERRSDFILSQGLS